VHSDQITKDYAGTVDLGTGDGVNPIQVRCGSPSGLDATEPCPVCNGDVTPNDGVRDGTCSAGARQNQPCDINGVHPTFVAVSMDASHSLSRTSAAPVCCSTSTC
jgi:hypothetical protein